MGEVIILVDTSKMKLNHVYFQNIMSISPVLLQEIENITQRNLRGSDKWENIIKKLIMFCGGEALYVTAILWKVSTHFLLHGCFTVNYC